ncbi:MAG: SGNH/GDSL hydrolase family protein [Chloroflexota bacterium]|nr:MAG: SGNH/GDSL hydrolase family protein [Chloroflexota bacterium]
MVLVVAACGPGAPSPSSGGPAVTPSPDGTAVTRTLRYVALGDSYTIGTSVRIAERWPDQLVAMLGAEPPTLELVANLAVNGFTSADALAVELPALEAHEPDFVTLLIGVNDIVRGVPEATYRRNVGVILDALAGRVGADRVIVVTTPDYTVTPAGADYGDPAEQAAGIRAFNAVLAGAAEARGIVVVDIHDLSLRAATDRALVARDGLHPSGAQYATWVERIAPAVGSLLGR